MNRVLRLALIAIVSTTLAVPFASAGSSRPAADGRSQIQSSSRAGKNHKALGCRDTDNDGFCKDDCDNGNPAVFPGADEICDGVNDDCSDPGWPGLPETELDQDGDGWAACNDCDDSDASVYPGAPQICDGVNNDCAHPAWPDRTGTTEIDDDLDGFSECAGDCGDLNGSVFPGSAEICDGRDNSCSGQVDDAPNCLTNCAETAILAAPGKLTELESREVSLAWNGTALGVAWTEVSEGLRNIRFARLDSSGQQIGEVVKVTDHDGGASQPSLAWSGAGWGLAWTDGRHAGSEIYFAALGASGQPAGEPTRITDVAFPSYDPSLVWGNAEFAVAWTDARNSEDPEAFWSDIYLARIADDGRKTGRELRVSSPELLIPPILDHFFDDPTLIWTGSEYVVAWDFSYDDVHRPYLSRFDPSGRSIGDPVPVGDPSDPLDGIDMAWIGDGFGIAWSENRDVIWFATLDATGAQVGGLFTLADRLLTGGTAASPAVSWNGRELAVAWEDSRDANREIYFAVLDAQGATVRPTAALTDDPGRSASAQVTSDGTGFGFVWEDDRAGAATLHFSRVGCESDGGGDDNGGDDNGGDDNGGDDNGGDDSGGDDSGGDDSGGDDSGGDDNGGDDNGGDDNGGDDNGGGDSGGDDNGGDDNGGDDNGGDDAMGPDFFSTSTHQFAPGMGTLRHDNLYSLAPETRSMGFRTPPYLASHVGLDAVDMEKDGTVLFSVTANGVVNHNGGSSYLRRDRIYRYDPDHGTIALFLQWADLGLDPGSVDALDRLEDGSIVISTDADRFVAFPGGNLVLRHENAYRVDLQNSSVTLYFDGTALGLRDLDAIDAIGTDRVAFSTATTIWVAGRTRRPNSAYVLEPDGSLTLAIDGEELGLQTLDAISLARGSE